MSFIITCPHCQEKLQAEDEWEGQAATCLSCGARFIIRRDDNDVVADDATQSADQGTIMGKVDEAIRAAFKLNKLEGFSFSHFMRQVFKRHSWEDTETYLAQGTPMTTPPITDVDATWPAPWVFARGIFFTVIFAFFLTWLKEFFGVSNVVMPYVIVGLIGIPFAMLLFFWEVNIPKNISILSLVRIVLISGFVSIAITILIREIIVDPENAIWAGPIEELAKLMTILFFFRNKKYKFLLNGILIGAAVGTGFEIIENGGYLIESFMGDIANAIDTFLDGVMRYENADLAMDAALNGKYSSDKNLITRTLSSVTCHILWSSITGAALWVTKKNGTFSFSNLANGRFLRLFACAIGLHMFHNSQILGDQYIIKLAIIAVIGYVVVIHLIQEGINEVRKIKSSVGQENATEKVPSA